MKEKIQNFFNSIAQAFRSRKAKGIPAPRVGIPLPNGPKIGALKGINLKAISNLDWEKVYRKSFIYNSVAAVICAYFVADFMSLALSPWYPAMEQPRPRRSMMLPQKDITAFNNIFTRNLFNIKGLIPDNDETGAGLKAPPVRTSLPLNLLGVIVVSDELKSVASVEDKGSNQVLAVRVNEPLVSGTSVQKIESNRVIFINRNTERREFIELPKDVLTATARKASKPGAAAGIVNNGGGHYSIDRKEVDAALTNLNEVLTQARCLPNFEAGKPSGYRCFQIVPGSIYDKLGMQENDVITSINGQPINDPAKAFTLLTSLRDQSTRNIELTLNRGGRVMNLQYDIE